ncbi:hypothetical protein D3C76_1318200 [compost metagenome]
MTRTDDVGMSQFVDQDQLRFAQQCGVQIELGQCAVLVDDLFEGQHVQVLGQRLGFSAAMGFDHADQYIGVLLFRHLGGRQHGVGLADTGAGTKENLQPTAFGLRFFFANLGQ